MKIGKKALLFSIGGAGYVGLEYLWRGWSHGSMFLAGGSAFLLLGALREKLHRFSAPVRGICGAGVITAVELIAGLLVNRNYTVWDYRPLPLNFMGQICLPFSLLWIPVSLLGMFLYRLADRGLRQSRQFLLYFSSVSGYHGGITGKEG